MAWVAVGGLAVSAVGSGIKLAQGSKQNRNAQRIRNSISDPGVERNYALERNAEVLGNDYNNYFFPGMQSYLDQIKSGEAFAINQGIQGASSSGDVLDLISQAQFGSQNAMNELFTQQAQGKRSALSAWLGANQAVGADQVRVNQENRNVYNSRVGEAAALEGASMQNTNNAYNEILTGVGNLYNTTFAPRTSVNQATGKVENTGSVWSNYWKNKGK